QDMSHLPASSTIPISTGSQPNKNHSLPSTNDQSTFACFRRDQVKCHPRSRKYSSFIVRGKTESNSRPQRVRCDRLSWNHKLSGIDAAPIGVSLTIRSRCGNWIGPATFENVMYLSESMRPASLSSLLSC